jgi:bacterioferritin
VETQEVSQIVAELQISYATEIETIQDYLANASNLGNSRAEPIKKLFDEEVQTALSHARRLAKRIQTLEGRVPGSRELPKLHKLCQPPADATDVNIVLIGAIKSQDAAIAQYERIIQLCDGYDFVTLDLVLDLLIEERERRRRLLALMPGVA